MITDHQHSIQQIRHHYLLPASVEQPFLCVTQKLLKVSATSDTVSTYIFIKKYCSI